MTTETDEVKLLKDLKAFLIEMRDILKGVRQDAKSRD